MKYNLTIIISFFCISAFSQMEIKKERTFTGAALYGFMNGGADLYYEYGFKELISREVIFKAEEFTVDVYTMETPLDAFGIYSIHAYKCLRADSLGRFDCQSKYQLQAVDGNNYVSIVFQSGSQAARKAADELYSMFVAEGKTGIRFPGQLTYMTTTISGSVKYMKGNLGINTVQPSLMKLLEGMDSYEIWYVENTDRDNLILFMFQESRDCTQLQKRIPSEKIIRRGEKFVMTKE